MIEGVEFTVSYEPVDGNRSFCITIAIASTGRLIIFVFKICNSFQNTILPNPEETVYQSLPYLYLEWYKRKRPKYPSASINQKELCTQSIELI